MTKLSRREFLRGAVLAGTGAVLPKVEQSTRQAQVTEGVEKVIEVNTGPEIADRHFESYHSVSFDFDLEQCIANLPGLRGFWPWPKLESFEYGDPVDWDLEPYLARCPRTDLYKPVKKYKAELSVEYGTPPSVPPNSQDIVVWYGLHEYTTTCFVPKGTRQVFLNE